MGWKVVKKKNIDFRNVPLGHFASDSENGILPMWHFWPAIKKKLSLQSLLYFQFLLFGIDIIR